MKGVNKYDPVRLVQVKIEKYKRLSREVDFIRRPIYEKFVSELKDLKKEMKPKSENMKLFE